MLTKIFFFTKMLVTISTKEIQRQFAVLSDKSLHATMLGSHHKGELNNKPLNRALFIVGMCYGWPKFPLLTVKWADLFGWLSNSNLEMSQNSWYYLLHWAITSICLHINDRYNNGNVNSRILRIVSNLNPILGIKCKAHYTARAMLRQNDMF